MEKLQKAGKCKAIGISNFSVKKTKDLLGHAKIKPAVQQIEIHPYWRNDACVEFCQQQVSPPQLACVKPAHSAGKHQLATCCCLPTPASPMQSAGLY